MWRRVPSSKQCGSMVLNKNDLKMVWYGLCRLYDIIGVECQTLKLIENDLMTDLSKICASCKC